MDNLYINRGITGAIVARQPFDSFKLSGIGSKAGGRDDLLQFLNRTSLSRMCSAKALPPLQEWMIDAKKQSGIG